MAVLGKDEGQAKVQKDCMPEALYGRKMKRLQVLVKGLEDAVQAVTDETDETDETAASCPLLSRRRKLLISADSVGRVAAASMIITAAAFELFDGPGKSECYAGAAPFSHSSESSLHPKARAPHQADNVMERPPHSAAAAVAHRTGGELKMYYERKAAEWETRCLRSMRYGLKLQQKCLQPSKGMRNTDLFYRK